MAEVSPEHQPQNVATVEKNAEKENDSDAGTIYLDSESEDEKEERVGPEIENTIKSNNPKHTITKNTRCPGMDEIQRVKIVLDKSEVASQLNALHVRRQRQTEQRRKEMNRIKRRKELSNSTALIYHRKKHLNEFPIHCRVCFKLFSNSSEKRDHEMICTILRYECYACKFISQDRTGMTRHMRIHMPGKKPFGCEYCNKKYIQKWNLDRHVKLWHW